MTLPEIQMQIISKLKNAATLRYSDIKPKGTPNDLFNYHLKSLLTKNLVNKLTDGYTLSQSGQAYVADVYHTSDPQHQRLFKINVITIVSRINTHGDIEILNQRRNSQPSHGIVDVMGGTILKGEDLLVGASRKLKVETGLSAQFQLLGFERRRLYKQGSLFSDVLFPICYAREYSGELSSTQFGENFWVSIDDAIKNTHRPFDNIASIATCLMSIRDNNVDTLALFYEETVQKEFF